MRQLETPAVIQRYNAANGPLHFSFFEDTDQSFDDVSAAIDTHLRGDSGCHPDFDLTVDISTLPEMPRRRISKAKFLGDWYDPGTGLLLNFGTYYSVPLGRSVNANPDPRLSDLCEPIVTSEELKHLHNHYEGRVIIADTEDDPFHKESIGQFAYAFFSPPHGMGADFPDVQRMFEEIEGLIFPSNDECEITDWRSERLVDLSNYFRDGLECWGVYLFTIFATRSRRLTVISGSDTD